MFCALSVVSAARNQRFWSQCFIVRGNVRFTIIEWKQHQCESTAQLVSHPCAFDLRGGYPTFTQACTLLHDQCLYNHACLHSCQTCEGQHVCTRVKHERPQTCAESAVLLKVLSQYPIYSVETLYHIVKLTMHILRNISWAAKSNTMQHGCTSHTALIL